MQKNIRRRLPLLAILRRRSHLNKVLNIEHLQVFTHDPVQGSGRHRQPESGFPQGHQELLDAGKTLHPVFLNIFVILFPVQTLQFRRKSM